MSSKSKKILIILFLAFVLAFIALAYYFNSLTEEYAIQEAEKSVQDALLTHRAIHQYVTKISRPEIYRLKKEGKLYEDYFSPKTMSFTYIARGIKDLLNKERKEAGLPEIYFKLASTNPRNEINRADTKEADLLRLMNENKLDKHREILEDTEGNKTLYYAMATEPIVEGCLKCHGDPQDAPAEMVSLYPESAGYFEEVGDIRALISIRIPLDQYLLAGHRIAKTMTIIACVILAAIYGLIFFFIRQIDRQNGELKQLSVRDYLTGIYNRMGFMKLSEHELSVAKRYKKPFSLVMFDLDYFKDVNDTYGHDTGDKLLSEITGVVSDRIRSSDLFGRWGGEEFVIAIPEQDIDGAQSLAEELRDDISKTTFAGKLNITASFGITELSGNETFDELVIQADKALYQSKDAGRNCVSIFSEKD
jgi:diguanylate cyclase (GGDEF)-like protein